jgi:hypothetical protein
LWANLVEKNDVVSNLHLRDALEISLNSLPHPNPLPKGEGFHDFHFVRN